MASRRDITPARLEIRASSPHLQAFGMLCREAQLYGTLPQRDLAIAP
ncbi:hypothetical protein [Citrobacter portucalensis]|nr:hypothetical protein [Citrobacter portucalensis]